MAKPRPLPVREDCCLRQKRTQQLRLNNLMYCSALSVTKNYVQVSLTSCVIQKPGEPFVKQKLFGLFAWLRFLSYF